MSYRRHRDILSGELFSQLLCLSQLQHKQIHSYFHCTGESQNKRKKCCKQKMKREKTMCSQLEKVTEIIMICPLINPYFVNYGPQQVIFSGNLAKTFSFSMLFDNFHVCTNHCGSFIFWKHASPMSIKI